MTTDEKITQIYEWLKQMVERPHAPIAGNQNPEPKTPISPDLVEVFGGFYDSTGRIRVYPSGSQDEVRWLQHQDLFGGMAALSDLSSEQQDALSGIVEHYALNEGLNVEPKVIRYNGRLAVVLDIPGLGYGTPGCYMIGTGNLASIGAERMIQLIQQRRAKS